MVKIKEYHDLTDIEKNIIREYQTWCTSKCELNYKIAMATQYRKRAENENIEHLL